MPWPRPGNAAILAADVVGYSKLVGSDEERTLARLRALRRDLIDPSIAVHHGLMVKRTGDGSIIEFRSVVDAVRCAIEVQNGMVERNAGLPPERRIEFRVGIDKRENPSNYCLFVMSEGAEWEGYRLREYGEADAYGHRKKANVAEDLSDVIKKHTGEETVVSDLTYDLRSGGPDFTDRLVATTFGTIALDAAREGKSGLMTAIVNGSYALVEIPDPKLGPRKMDVETMYNKERLRPNYSNKVGLPIFLTRT
jgi:hypothetical protein